MLIPVKYRVLAKLCTKVTITWNKLRTVESLPYKIV